MQTLADVVEYMQQNKMNPLIVDSWDSEKKEIYALLKTMPRITHVANYKVRVNTTPGCGMGEYPGEYPAEIEVSILLDFK